VGCCLLDYLYSGIDFSSAAYQKYISLSEGDGGLCPGKLVLTDDFEQFSGKSFNEVVSEIVGSKPYDVYNLGGPAIVALIHAAQLLSSQADVRFYAALGDDQTGQIILSIIEKTPIQLAKIIYSQKDTPYTYVLSDPDYDKGHGERSFINNIGAAWDIIGDDLDEHFYQSDIIVFGGTALVPNIGDQLPVLLKKGKEKGCITVVNTVYNFLKEKKDPGKPWQLGGSEETYRYIDLLIMDLEEALRISGKPDIDQALDYYIKSGVSAFIITNGAQPVLLYSDGNLFRKTKDVVQMPVSELIINSLKDGSNLKGDTTGCGDNFVGGVIAAMTRQLQGRKTGELNLLKACSWGIVSGGYACFYMGGTYLEKEKLEKYRLILPYFEAYRTQITGE